MQVKNKVVSSLGFSVVLIRFFFLDFHLLVKWKFSDDLQLVAYFKILLLFINP